MKRFQVWSSGGGTQSSAIAVLILKGLLPRPDAAVIADTGRENPETWEYLGNIVNPALLKKFGDFQVERIPIEQFGWPPAPKSACWMCPNQPDAHWRWLRDNRPIEWAMACAVDEEARTKTSNAFLHRSCVPLAQADLGQDGDDAKQLGLGCGSGDCFV